MLSGASTNGGEVKGEICELVIYGVNRAGNQRPNLGVVLHKKKSGFFYQY